MTDMRCFVRQIDPMSPNVSRHHYIDIYQHKKDLQEIKLSGLHSVCNAQEWKGNYMSDPNLLKQTNMLTHVNLEKEKKTKL